MSQKNGPGTYSAVRKRRDSQRERVQLNVRCLPEQLAFWQVAAELAGYTRGPGGKGGVAAWVKNTLTLAAAEVLRNADAGLAGAGASYPEDDIIEVASLDGDQSE